MRKLFFIILCLGAFVLSSCSKLDLNPLSEGSSGNWYSDETQITMSLNDLFRSVFWPRDNDLWTDDFNFRGENNAITAGTFNGENSTAVTLWSNSYKAINRSIKVIESLDKVRDKISEEKLKVYEANARFVRASRYADLIAHFGDVPFYENSIDIEQAFEMERSPKNEVLQKIYEDYDYAAENLPLEYSGSEIKYATKGAALGLKARIALYMNDYSTARDASKSLMDLNYYKLFPDYRTLFLSSTKYPLESIFALPQSVELGQYEADTKYYISRLAGGFGSRNPTFELFCSYLCTDGLPIDQSPLFNPRNPFENRDPRCTEVVVEHNTPWLGFMFTPHPDSLTVLNVKTGSRVKNNDSRANNINAPFNGLLRKKGIDEDYSDDYMADPDIMILRYADVLLMYAEAKIELNEIDNSVLNAINSVRARAYKVDVSETGLYPAITTTNQAELRTQLRFERRMELPFENLRYMDILRWRLAEKVLNRQVYGMLDVADLRTKVVQTGLWYLPGVPPVDNDAVPDMTPLYNAGLLKLFSLQSFDKDKNYLWPIPSKEVLISNNKIKQNPNY